MWKTCETFVLSFAFDLSQQVANWMTNDSHDESLDEGVRVGREVGVFGQQGVKAEGEGDDEEGADDGHLQEGLHHVGEHDHVDAQEGELPDVGKLGEQESTLCYRRCTTTMAI